MYLKCLQKTKQQIVYHFQNYKIVILMPTIWLPSIYRKWNFWITKIFRMNVTHSWDFILENYTVTLTHLFKWHYPAGNLIFSFRFRGNVSFKSNDFCNTCTNEGWTSSKKNLKKKNILISPYCHLFRKNICKYADN